VQQQGWHELADSDSGGVAFSTARLQLQVLTEKIRGLPMQALSDHEKQTVRERVHNLSLEEDGALPIADPSQEDPACPSPLCSSLVYSTFLCGTGYGTAAHLLETSPRHARPQSRSRMS
jgi:hypothetical protein